MWPRSGMLIAGSARGPPSDRATLWERLPRLKAFPDATTPRTSALLHFMQRPPAMA